MAERLNYDVMKKEEGILSSPLLLNLGLYFFTWLVNTTLFSLQMHSF